MNFIRRQWYNIAIGTSPLFIIIAFLFFKDQIISFILLLNFVALQVHQYEEYGWPGGGPWIRNQVATNSERPDRYPLNQNNAFFINVIFAWPFYLIPVFYPQTVWLGLAPVIFGFSQFIGHGIYTNIKIKSFYNPGLVAVVFGHIPLGIWYLCEVYKQQLITNKDWIFATIYVVIFAAVFMGLLGYNLLKSKDSIYPFSSDEMERYNRKTRLEKLKRSSSVE